MSDVELLPCPFCNSEPKLRYIGNEWTKSRKITVICTGCRIEVTHAAIRYGFDFLEAAIKKTWNARVLNKQAIENAAYERAKKAVANTEVKTMDYYGDDGLETLNNAIANIDKLKSSTAGEGK